MPLDLSFIVLLLTRMAVTAAFVLLATITAQRSGPLLGGLIATLPIAAGPAYVFLALDHPPSFIAGGALASLTINSVNVIFALTYALLAQKRSLLVSLGGAFVFWLVLAFSVYSSRWSFTPALLANIVVFGIALPLARPMRLTRMPPFRPHWSDLVLRAAMVASLVGLLVTLSSQIGPAGSGILAVFPVVLMSIMLILHNRVGGPASAAVLANAVLGLVGFGFACVALYFTAEPLGSWIGLALALAVSIGWSLLVLFARKRGLKV
jgi:uncharacterized membrane protein (GlpM family)